MLDPGWVAEAFNLGRPTTPLTRAARGELGIIWHLATDRGQWAVKELLFPEGETGADVVLQLAAVEAGLPLPRPLLTGTGAPIAVEGPTAVRAYEWVDLDPDASCPPRSAGELLAGVHRLGVPAGETHWFYYRPLGRDGWKRLGERASATTDEWGARLSELVGRLQQAEQDWVSGRPPGPSAVAGHMDFNGDNVRMRRQGGPVILDWENAAATDAAQEAAMAAVEFMVGAGPTWDWGAGRAFVDGYREAGGRFVPTGPEVFAMAFVCQAHLFDLYSGRAGGAAGSEEQRRRAQDNLRVMTACPLTPELAFELLDRWAE